jgi:hypothetical protein
VSGFLAIEKEQALPAEKILAFCEDFTRKLETIH